MNRPIMLLIIGLIFGAGIGFTIAATSGLTLSSKSHPHAPGTGAHGHDTMVTVAEGDDAPTVLVEAFQDPMSGWNLKVTTTNFRFSPENASGPNVDGEGHAHVYINGTKLGRLYGPWMHLGNLPTGDVTIKVSLNGNNHSPISVGENLVENSVQISN